MEDLNNFKKVPLKDIFAGFWPTYQTFDLDFDPWFNTLDNTKCVWI